MAEAPATLAWPGRLPGRQAAALWGSTLDRGREQVKPVHHQGHVVDRELGAPRGSGDVQGAGCSLEGGCFQRKVWLTGLAGQQTSLPGGVP
jgi:hypothetical protein